MQNLESHVAFLVKFTSSEYVSSFVDDGLLFMNSIEYFRNIENEDSVLRGDANEGLAARYSGENIVLKIGGEEINALTGNLSIRFNHDQETNIFCMSAITAKDVADAGGELKLSNDFKKFGDKAIMIHGVDIPEFLERIMNHIKSNDDISSHPDHKFIAKKVDYIPYQSHQGKIGVYKKFDEYAWQYEWRLAIKQQVTDGTYSGFKIGPINDLCQVVDTDSIINETIGIKELI
ncbi:hypothetical protein [Endozoicomonas ascidiicola]|uniref:hypothetical protein n=1 Tax=Endozoicomonas ascidiicola TaxID=1698521 RepID=UPI0008336E24|nr:hypothetical protein [Endozoicomonas ascidiicola]